MVIIIPFSENSSKAS